MSDEEEVSRHPYVERLDRIESALVGHFEDMGWSVEYEEWKASWTATSHDPHVELDLTQMAVAVNEGLEGRENLAHPPTRDSRPQTPMEPED